jgi:hypothetical protein
MRTQNTTNLIELLSPKGIAVSFNNPLDLVCTFATCHREIINREINELSKIEGLKTWVLELSTTSLFWLLSFWGEKYDSIEAWCDSSKPIQINRQLFDVMIGRQDKIYMTLGRKREVALTYNLSGPINLVNSRGSPGIQIADIISSSINYCFKNPDEEVSKEWLDISSSMFSDFNILPERKTLDLGTKESFINASVLFELVDRTLKGESLLVDWENFLIAAEKMYPLWLSEQHILKSDESTN